jgi:hypothetical protein
MNWETISEYCAFFRGGETPPPLEVFEVEGELVVVDGFHRLEAGRRAGVVTLPVKIVGKGSMADAQRHALGTNQKPGLPRTRADKRRAVKMALDLYDGQSNRQIAKHVGVSHVFVANVRNGNSRGEQLEMPQPGPDVEELRKEADTMFESGEFERAKLRYEKAAAVSSPEDRSGLEDRVRQCEEKQAPGKRAERIRHITEARHSKRCVACGLKGGVVVRLVWTEVAHCVECLDDMLEKARAAHEPARRTNEEQRLAEAAWN